MQAKETRLQEIIEGTKQYVIPLFQRSYSWTQKEWSILWKDISELADMEVPRVHFMGSIVTMPTTSVPHGVAKYLLIDGQQRLTTIFVVLSLLRNKAREIDNQKLADKIQNILLVNQYEEGNDYYKLLPTQFDRTAYQQIVDQNGETSGQIQEAYLFFEKKLRNCPHGLDKLLKILTDCLSVVSIVLGADDNPYLVFESLNAKGRKLTQADLIKNYFFMRIHQGKQDEIYRKYWLPMQTYLDEKQLPEYIRHYMMKEGGIIRQTDVYYSLKERVNVNNAIEYIRDLCKYSQFYRNIIHPEYESNKELRKSLTRLNRIEQTTAYPVLLYFYGEYESKNITAEEFIEILSSLENYLIRRFVCDYKTSELNKIFPAAYSFIKDYKLGNSIEAFRSFLSSKGYPKDGEFKAKFRDTRMYGGGDRIAKTRFILERLEEGYHHKEINVDNLTIEHVMPQTLSVWWQKNLGEYWEDVHEELLNTIGNLTLTAYNSELSNDDYDTKRLIFSSSHLELNKYFAAIPEWRREQIIQRAIVLSEKATEVWPYFGDNEAHDSNEKSVKGTTPYSIEILGETFAVKTWRDVFEYTLNTLYDLEPAKFKQVADVLSSYIGKDKNKFRAIRQLSNGYYIEVNQSAPSILKNCLMAIKIVGLSNADWIVNYTSDGEKHLNHLSKKDNVDQTNENLNNIVKEGCIERISNQFGRKLVQHSNTVYTTDDNKIGFYFAFSKAYIQPTYERYWFGFRKKEALSECSECYYVFGSKDGKKIIMLPKAILDKHLDEMNVSVDNETGEIKHWHVVFTIDNDNTVKWSLSKPEMHEINITEYLL